MEEPFLLSDQSGSSHLISVTRADTTDFILIHTAEGLTIVNFKSKKTEMVLAARSWSKQLPIFYSKHLKALVMVSDSGSTIFLYKATDSVAVKKDKKSKLNTVNNLPFKEKPKKFTLEEKIMGIDVETEYGNF